MYGIESFISDRKSNKTLLPPSLCLNELHLNCIYSSLVKKNQMHLFWSWCIIYHYFYFEFLFLWFICGKPWSSLQLLIILPNSVMVDICLFDKVRGHFLFISLIWGSVFCYLGDFFWIQMLKLKHLLDCAKLLITPELLVANHY